MINRPSLSYHMIVHFSIIVYQKYTKSVMENYLYTMEIMMYIEKKKNERFLRMQEDYEAQQNEIKRLEAAIRQFRQWGREGDNEKFSRKP